MIFAQSQSVSYYLFFLSTLSSSKEKNEMNKKIIFLQAVARPRLFSISTSGPLNTNWSWKANWCVFIVDFGTRSAQESVGNDCNIHENVLAKEHEEACKGTKRALRLEWRTTRSYARDFSGESESMHHAHMFSIISSFLKFMKCALCNKSCAEFSDIDVTYHLKTGFSWNFTQVIRERTLWKWEDFLIFN